METSIFTFPQFSFAFYFALWVWGGLFIFCFILVLDIKIFLFSHFFQICHWKNVSFREILESNYDYIIFNIYKILEGLVSLWNAYVWDWAEICLKFIVFKIKISGLIDWVILLLLGAEERLHNIYSRGRKSKVKVVEDLVSGEKSLPGLEKATFSLWAMVFPHSSVGKESTCNAGDPSSIPGSGRSSGEGIGYPFQYSWACLVAQLVRNPPTMREIWVLSLGWEDPLEKGKATHSSILAWRSPWTPWMASQRVGHDWVTFTSLHLLLTSSCGFSCVLAQKESSLSLLNRTPGLLNYGFTHMHSYNLSPLRTRRR